MALSKLGRYIDLKEIRNSDVRFGVKCVKGISTQKLFIETKADMEGISLYSYKVVEPKCFAYVADTSRRGDKISLAYNFSKDYYLVSSISTVFYVKDENVLLPEYLYIYFNRPEFDRLSRFNSWGSAREAFTWDDMCDIDIELPDIKVQQKYVDLYTSMVANQECYEQGLEDLKLTCDAYIEDLRRKMPCEKIGKYIERNNDRNRDKAITNVMGLSTLKQFREAQVTVNRKELSTYKIVQPLEIAFVPTTDTWKLFAFALNDTGKQIVVSPIYEVFRIKENGKMLPEYLCMWFKRKEFDRYARYNSWGSARENFSYEDLIEVEIPIPLIEIQKDIVAIFNAYNERKAINEKLKTMIKDICPILIKGSLEEGRK